MNHMNHVQQQKYECTLWIVGFHPWVARGGGQDGSSFIPHSSLPMAELTGRIKMGDKDVPGASLIDRD